MGTALALPRRPGHYGHGPDMAVGTYHVVCTVGGYTVQRTIGLAKWFPLTARDNPAWRTWPTFEAASDWLELETSPVVVDWPHWGRA